MPSAVMHDGRLACRAERDDSGRKVNYACNTLAIVFARMLCEGLIQGMMAIEHGEEQGRHATATREDMRGVRRAEGIDEGSHGELADHSEHQRPVGHGPNLLNRYRHAVSLLQVC